ncbi:MAG: glycosyltransferase family 2 protein [Bdellovibrionales bacterium]
MKYWPKAQKEGWKRLAGWDFHQATTVSQEPECRILAERVTSPPRVSVIIPVHNDANALQLSLARWLNQKSQFSYEVIVVDDGSDDQVFEKVSQQFDIAGSDYRFLRLDRPQRRVAGDRQFRAGVVRNVGASFARGEVLIFADSDILVPSGSLEATALAARSGSLSQARRLQLTKWPDENRADDELRTQVDPDYSPYWRDFQSNPLPWNQVKSRWKYVSTFYLSLTKKDFFDLGWFRKNYVQYGCEDTDLGWRAQQSNFGFNLLDLEVFHLPAGELRSEYQNDFEIKRRLLAPAFVQLYRNVLDNEVFDELVEPHADLIPERG